jgi:hypothetical protein
MQALDTLDPVRAPVDRMHPAVVSAGDDVVQDLPADGAAPPARTDDSDGRRLEQAPEAGDLGPAGADLDGIQVAVQPFAVGGGQRKRQLEYSVREMPLDGQPGIGETRCIA